MNKFIKRSAVLDLLHYFVDERCSAVVSDIEEIPSADVVPVVRCRDCVSFVDFGHEDYGCNLLCATVPIRQGMDGFCSLGKKGATDE